MDDTQIVEGVREAIAEALGLEMDEVEANSALFDELGAESLDLLDIVFRLEKTFDIKIPRGGVQQDALAAEGVSEDEVVQDGALTALGAEKLREKMDEVDASKLVEGFRIDDIPTLFTVQTFVKIVKEELAAK